MRRRRTRRLIWVYTVCSGLSVWIYMVNTVPYFSGEKSILSAALKRLLCTTKWQSSWSCFLYSFRLWALLKKKLEGRLSFLQLSPVLVARPTWLCWLHLYQATRCSVLVSKVYMYLLTILVWRPQKGKLPQNPASDQGRHCLQIL